MRRWAIALIWLLAAAAAPPAAARVDRIEIDAREAFASGQSFGPAGAYERIAGRLVYAVDPDHPANRDIVDLRLAPRDGRGKVAFAGDFLLLTPADPARGNGRLLMEVTNRGNLGMLTYLDFAPATNDPRSRDDAGDGLLLERGYSLLWTAWNWDVLPGAGRLQIELPAARQPDGPIVGTVVAEMVADRPVRSLPFAWGHSRGYPVATPDKSAARLTVRPQQRALREPVPEAAWEFAREAGGRPEPSGTHLFLHAGFRPGLIYELVYPARDPRIVGLGLASLRDALSFFRFEAADSRGVANPLHAGTRPAHALVFGISQSGRVIQHMLLQGFHLDERGRAVFDGALIHVAGGGKGSFNHRFAQTTRHPSQHEDHQYPADFFPFATVPSTDPLTGERGDLLQRAQAAGAVPRLVYVGTATEYWTRSASLLHTDAEGRRGLDLAPEARLYVAAGAQHFNYAPPRPEPFVHCWNPADHRPLLRALLVALDDWATRGVEPPDSAYPRIADGALGPLDAYRAGFPAIPGAPPPGAHLEPPRLDLGPRFAAEGVADLQPPAFGPPYRTLLPLPDADGNDRGGVRLPELAAPLGTHTGWNLRGAEAGNAGILGRWAGSFLPFARTAGERGDDPRPAIAERYRDAADYRARVQAEAAALVGRRLMLERDVARVVARADRAYDFLMRPRSPEAPCLALPQ